MSLLLLFLHLIHYLVNSNISENTFIRLSLSDWSFGYLKDFVWLTHLVFFITILRSIKLILPKNNNVYNMPQWLKSLTVLHWSLTAGGFKSHRGWKTFMWGSYPVSLRKVDGSTRMPAHSLQMHEEAPGAFIHQNQLDVPKWTEMCWWDYKQNSNSKHCVYFMFQLSAEW